MSEGMRQLRRLLLQFLRVGPGEGQKVALFSTLLFFLVGYFVTGRVTRDSLFLSRYSVDYLPVLYIWIATGISIQSLLYARVADRLRRDRLVFFTILAVGAATLLARALLPVVGSWFYPVLYVFVELAGTLLVIEGWTLANDVFTTREARRLFGLVGAGSVFGSLTLGLWVRWAVSWAGTENQLLVSAALLAGAALVLRRISHQFRQELLLALGQGEKRASWLVSGLSRIVKDRQLTNAALITALAGVCITLIDYQFKLAARSAFVGQEKQLAGFFGTFWAVTGGINCLLQLFMTGRLLEKGGVFWGLALLPLALLGGTIGLGIWPVLATATFLKGSEAVLRYTVHDAGIQLLYLPVPAAFRGRAKAFIDGMVRPLAVGFSGAALAWAQPGFPAPALLRVMAVALLLWLWLAFSARGNYYRSLMKTLKNGRFHFSEVGESMTSEAAARVLGRALESKDEKMVLGVLQLLEQAPDHDWSPKLRQLLENPSAQVRERACELLGRMGKLSDGPAIQRLLQDPDIAVRARAIEAYCALGKERAVRLIGKFLKHPQRELQAAALVGLIRFGGLDGILTAAERLKSLLESERPEERALGARILGNIGVRNFFQPLIRLMVDEVLEVRLEAIRAAGKMQSQELLPALVYRLSERACRTQAAEALVAYGEKAVHVLSRLVENEAEALPTRMAAIRVLSRIGGPTVLQVLVKHLAHPEPRLRLAILEAIHQLLPRVAGARLDRQMIDSLLEEELKIFARLEKIRTLLGPECGELLVEALKKQQEEARRRCFLLLGCIYPMQTVDLVYSYLSSKERRLRANALEILDNLLDRRYKKLLLPLFDEKLEREREELLRQLSEEELRDPASALRWLAEKADSWTASCAIFEIRQRRLAELFDTVVAATASENPLVRETALLAAADLPVEKERARRLLANHFMDPEPQVRMLARHLASKIEEKVG